MVSLHCALARPETAVSAAAQEEAAAQESAAQEAAAQEEEAAAQEEAAALHRIGGGASKSGRNRQLIMPEDTFRGLRKLLSTSNFVLSVLDNLRYSPIEAP